MTSGPRSPFLPRDLPDGRVAHYAPQRRAFVVISKDESRQILNRTFIIMPVTFVLCAVCFVLWYMYSKSRIGLELPIVTTMASVIFVHLLESKIT